MNSHIKNTFAAATVILMISLAACFGGGSNTSADTGTTLTQAQFDALLESSTVYKAGQPAVFITAPSVTAYAARTMRRTEAVGAYSSQPQVTTSCTGIGTLTGRPPNSDPIQATVYSGISCTGYYFNISTAPTSADHGIIQGLPPSVTIYFDQPGCTGNPYVFGMSGAAIAQGFVARIDPTNADPTGADSASYWYLPAGAVVTAFTMQSFISNGGACQNSVNTGSDYKLLPNDSSATGIQSAPVAGPILIGS